MSWYQLYSIIQEQAAEEESPTTGRMPPPIACPHCGEPLIPGNPLEPTVILYCKADGWQFPRDWQMPDSNVF